MTAAPQSGDLIDDRYEVEVVAGEGGFSIAYRAFDRETGETVVVKYPNYEGSSNDPDVIDRYLRKEAEALRRIETAGGHPNVMTLYEDATHEAEPRLVVEFVDGYDLDAAIEETGPLADTEHVRQIGIDLCEAMSFLHEHEIVYRDLKPENIMITERDGGATPVLIDFNTAVEFEGGEAADGSTTILGPYKPREVAEADRSTDRQGPWSDVYSVGKILLFLLKGSVPRKDGVDPRHFGADCEPYLGEIVATATQTDPDERYPNATVMQRVLEAKDPSPPPAATVTYLPTGETYTVYPGDTVGRRDAAGPTPAIRIEDENEYISTVQIGFELDDDGQWIVRDRSLNGTYVQSGEGWQRVLGDAGRRRLEDLGEDPTDRNGEIPPETHPVRAGDLIALVHPGYGAAMRFEEG